MRVAIIGAGISGVVCGNALSQRGVDVTIFEKSRGVGGRMSTRKTPDEIFFDHGCQSFAATDQCFLGQVETWMKSGLVAEWEGIFGELERGKFSRASPVATRYVGTPTMNAPVKQLAESLAVNLNFKVSTCTYTDSKWAIKDDDSQTFEGFDALVLSIPPYQAEGIVDLPAEHVSQIRQTEMSRCWCLMLSLESSLCLPFDGAHVTASPISWLARNNSKPERPTTPETWCIHATPEWSEDHVDQSRDEISAALLNEFWAVTGCHPKPVDSLVGHRWMYAQTERPFGSPCIYDHARKLALGGDWLLGSRVEDAYLSGAATADALLD